MKKEHLVFNCAFLEIDADYNDANDLFQALDSRGRGYVDEEDFKKLFNGNIG
jgi:Ca2+-binding EF-hand superfamily protein